VTVVVAVAVAALLVAIAWLLLTPLVAQGQVEGNLDDGARIDVRLRFAPLAAHLQRDPAGPLRVDVTLAGIALPTRRSRPATSPSGGTVPRLARIHRRWRVDDLLRFLVRRRHHLVVRHIEGHVRYGFEDPALTGQVYGAVCTARPLLDPEARVAVMPDWSMQDVLAGRLLAELRLFVGRLAIALAIFLVTNRRRAA
jgi:hypothetical protein